VVPSGSSWFQVVPRYDIWVKIRYKICFKHDHVLPKLCHPMLPKLCRPMFPKLCPPMLPKLCPPVLPKLCPPSGPYLRYLRYLRWPGTLLEHPCGSELSVAGTCGISFCDFSTFWILLANRSARAGANSLPTLQPTLRVCWDLLWVVPRCFPIGLHPKTSPSRPVRFGL